MKTTPTPPSPVEGGKKGKEKVHFHIKSPNLLNFAFKHGTEPAA